MSDRYVLAPLAIDDIDAIVAYVEDEAGEEASDRVLEELYDAMAQIGRSPGLGHKRSDLADLPVFFWTVLKSYAVIYRKSTPIAIVRVLAWKRDIPVLLSMGTL